VSVIVVAVALALVVRFTRRLRNAREKVSVSPAPASPVEEKKTVELRPEWLPENTTIVTRALNVDNHAEDDTSVVAAIPKAKKGPKTVKGRKAPKKVAKPAIDYNHTTDKIQPLIFFQSVTGTTEKRAKQVAELLTAWTTGCDQSASFLGPQLLDLSDRKPKPTRNSST
jgi:tRNA wybutosine-synthesizing protein 1